MNGSTSDQPQSAQNNEEFGYILDRIEAAPFELRPFRHLLIENFLTPDHLSRVIADPQIALAPQSGTEALIAALHRSGYRVQPFPGCTTDIADYLRRLKRNDWPVDKAKLEGYTRSIC
jgi:hypothetical protein